MLIGILPPQVGRAARARRGATVALGMAACATLIGACGSSSSSDSSTTTTKTTDLDTPHVAHAIEVSILGQRHVHAQVTCPAVIVQQKGKSFVCIATTRDGNGVTHKTPFAVTQQNSSGYVTYHAE